MNTHKPIKEAGPDQACVGPTHEVAEKPPEPVPGNRPAPSPNSKAGVVAAEATGSKGTQTRDQLSPAPMTSELGSDTTVGKYTSQFMGPAGVRKTDQYVTEKGQEPYIT